MSALLPYDPDRPPQRTRTAPVLPNSSRDSTPKQPAVGPVFGVRLGLALAVAVAADALLPIVTPLEGFEVVFDLFIGLALCGLMGFNWVLVPALLAEAIPGLEVFPSWTLAVMGIAAGKQLRAQRSKS